MPGLSRRAFVTACFALGSAASASSQDVWPSRPIRVVVPSAAGGYDTYARTMAPRLSERLGQSVYIENRAGANGNIGMSEVAHSGDGHTFLFVPNGALTINSSVFKNMPLDTIKDLAPIARAVVVPMIWTTYADGRFKSLSDVIAVARAEPGKIDIDYANPGTGSVNHLVMEAFKQRHNLDMVSVPFIGTPAAQNEVIAGRIPLMVDSLGAAMGHLESKLIRALAVTTRDRAAALPDVPTAIELGLEDREYVGWYAFLGPKDTPPAVVQKFNAAVNAVLADQEVAARIVKLGAQPVQSTPDELRVAMTAERDIWGRVAQQAGLQPK